MTNTGMIMSLFYGISNRLSIENGKYDQLEKEIEVFLRKHIPLDRISDIGDGEIQTIGYLMVDLFLQERERG